MKAGKTPADAPANAGKKAGIAAGVLAIAVLAAGPASAAGEKCGKASWYALTSMTASGEMMDPSKFTAAHPHLPFGTVVRVRNQASGKAVDVRINDRGPFVKGRIIDVSKAAARQLAMISSGVAPVCFTVLG